ncbi:hypothetical protein ACFFRR_011508 [Megaselia abdita]
MDRKRDIPNTLKLKAEMKEEGELGCDDSPNPSPALNTKSQKANRRKFPVPKSRNKRKLENNSKRPRIVKDNKKNYPKNQGSYQNSRLLPRVMDNLQVLKNAIDIAMGNNVQGFQNNPRQTWENSRRDDYFDPMRDEFYDHSGRDDFANPRDDFDPRRDEFILPRDDFVLPRDDFDPRRDDFDPRDDFVHPREDFDPRRDDFVHPRDDFDPRRDDFVLPREYPDLPPITKNLGWENHSNEEFFIEGQPSTSSNLPIPQMNQQPFNCFPNSQTKKSDLPKSKSDHNSKYNNCMPNWKIPLEDPYWKPCFMKIPSKEMFRPGIFYIDQFLNLADKAQVKMRTFEDGTMMITRKGDTMVLKEPENSDNIGLNRCEMCSKKSHSIEQCLQVTCCLCKEPGHIGTRCPEPEKGDSCLACKGKDHNHSERGLCARTVYVLKNNRCCRQCGRGRHTAQTCRYVKCSLCEEAGHVGNDCPNQQIRPSVQEIPGELDDSVEAVLRCMICVRIGKSIYSAELNENTKFSQINPDSVRIEGYNGFSPSLRIPIKIGNIVHEINFLVNRELLMPISLGKETMKLFNIRVLMGDTQIGSGATVATFSLKKE